jgi:hypothetical protein
MAAQGSRNDLIRQFGEAYSDVRTTAVTAGRLNELFAKIDAISFDVDPGNVTRSGLEAQATMWRAGKVATTHNSQTINEQVFYTMFNNGMTALHILTDACFVKATGASSATLTQERQVKTMFLTEAEVVYPGRVTAGASTWRTTDMNSSIRTKVMDLGIQTLLAGDDLDMVAYNRMLKEIQVGLGYPVTGLCTIEMVKKIKDGVHPLELAAKFCMKVFVAGKTAGSDGASESVSEKRPKNLADKYNDGVYFVCHKGEVEWKPDLRVVIERCFETDTSFRLNLLKPLVTMNASTGGVAADMMMLVMGLLKHAHMAALDIVGTFLGMHPWAHYWRPVAAQAAKFLADVEAISTLDFRYRRHAKLLLGSEMNALDSRELSELIGLAKYVLIRRHNRTHVERYKADVNESLYADFTAYADFIDTGALGISKPAEGATLD